MTCVQVKVKVALLMLEVLCRQEVQQSRTNNTLKHKIYKKNKTVTKRTRQEKYSSTRANAQKENADAPVFTYINSLLLSLCAVPVVFPWIHFA